MNTTLPLFMTRLSPAPTGTEGPFIHRQDSAPRPALSEAALGVLAAHDWPGNVRELCNVVEVAALRTERGEISAETVKQVLQGPGYRRSRKVRLARVEAEALEKQLCLEAREKTGLPWYKLWEPLGYESESQLYRRLKKWEIT